MKRKIAATVTPPDQVCVISGDVLAPNTAFVLPCCNQTIAEETIITWLKQSSDTGCPCCRNTTCARDALIGLGHNLTPIEVHCHSPQSRDSEDYLIFNEVMVGISGKKTVEEKCKDYLEFGKGLMAMGRYKMAHDVIDKLEDMMASGTNKNILVAKTILDLIEPYMAYVAQSQLSPNYKG